MSSLLADILREMGSPPTKEPPAWVLALFAQDKDMIELQRSGA